MLFLEGRLIRPRTVKNVLGVLSQDGEKGIDIQIGEAVILADSAWRRSLRKLILLVQARFADRCQNKSGAFWWLGSVVSGHLGR